MAHVIKMDGLINYYYFSHVGGIIMLIFVTHMTLHDRGIVVEVNRFAYECGLNGRGIKFIIMNSPILFIAQRSVDINDYLYFTTTSTLIQYKNCGSGIPFNHLSKISCSGREQKYGILYDLETNVLLKVLLKYMYLAFIDCTDKHYIYIYIKC